MISEVLKATSIHAWIEANGIVNEKGEQLEFKDHLFLFDIYKDWNPNQSCIKAAQIGFSMMMVLKTIYAAKYKKFNIIYTLPTAEAVREFVPSKVDQLVTNNKALQDVIGNKDNYEQKKIGDRFIYFRGTFSGKSKEKKGESGVGIMLTSDLNIHDESDRSDQAIIEQYESRLGSSKFQGRWFFSNPSVPNIGAHKEFLLSDQKHWHVKCRHCNYWQYLTYDDNVDEVRQIYVCQKCHGEIGDEERRKGQWVRKWSHIDKSGYWISQLMAPWFSAANIIKKHNEQTPDHFNNFVLGLPYLAAEEKVDKQIILTNCVDKYIDEVNKDQVVIGVDQGLKKHYVIGNGKEIFKVGVVDLWDDIENMIKVYNAVAVIDSAPDLTIPRILMKKYLGRVFLCVYKRDRTQKEITSWGKDDRFGFVYADRNASLQETVDDLVNGKIKYAIKPSELSKYIDHWQTMYRRQEEDSLGIPHQIWESTTGEDHFAHATNYYRIGTKRKGVLQKLKPVVGGPVNDKYKNNPYVDSSFLASIRGQTEVD